MPSKYKFDWFQTDSHVTLTILKKNVELDNCKVSYTSDFLSVKAGDEEIFGATLSQSVDQNKFQVKCTPSKVELRMPKSSSNRWDKLCMEAKALGDGPSTDKVCFASRNWDQIEKQAVKEEEEENGEGDAAVNKMFQKIYADASDDVRKAMMKSYSESGGTVLSTNWEDIQKKKTEVRPPDSMEYKKWN